MEKQSPKAPDLPEDVAAIRAGIRNFFQQKDSHGNTIGSHKNGVYAFYDYDEEPIYVGQTYEKLSGRIGRHLTNQRTDAVAMNVLDPFEVAFIEVWPMDELTEGKSQAEVRHLLDRAEFTVFLKVLDESNIGAVLNEKPVGTKECLKLPPSYRSCIIPSELYSKRKHPDIRIARRAATIANLARVISERNVSDGLRVTLLTQAKRLEALAKQRLDEKGIDPTKRIPTRDME